MTKNRITHAMIATAQAEMDADFAAHHTAQGRATAEDWDRDYDVIGAATMSVLFGRGLDGSAISVAEMLADSFNGGGGKQIRQNFGVKLGRSDRASASYGIGGVEKQAWPYAGKYSRYPAVWRDYGCQWRVDGRRLVLDLYNSRSKLVATIPAPASLGGISTDGITYGDLYSLPARRSDVRRRYDADRKQTGVALRLAGGGWEHGATVEACLAEIAHKAQVAAAQVAARRMTAREQRRDRLLARISTQVIVTRADGRAAGSCQAGIDGWCGRVGLADRDGIPAREIMMLARATGEERRALAACIIAMRRHDALGAA